MRQSWPVASKMVIGPMPDRPAHAFSQMATAELPGARVHYDVYGEGPWLVFAHGAGGNRLSWWQQIPHFAARFRCVVYDQPGWGASTCNGGPDPRRFAP